MATQPDPDEKPSVLGTDDLPYVRTPWPALDRYLRLAPKQYAVLSLPHEADGGTPLRIARYAAAQGYRPRCVYPGWPASLDGGLSVRRSDTMSFASAGELAGVAPSGTGLVVVDQFSRIGWDGADREDAVEEVGRTFQDASKEHGAAVLVIVRRPRDRGPHLSLKDLHSDGALEYHSRVFVMVEPEPDGKTATLHVAKNRTGPAPITEVVEWDAACVDRAL